MMQSPTLQRVKEADVGFIHDDMEEQFWWLLRCLPALNYIGFETFTYPTSWRTLNTGGPNQSYNKQFDYLDYQYRVLGEVEDHPDEIGDLVVITTEYYEGQTQHSVSDLINRYSARPETLIVVSNTKRFTPVGAQRPLYMEQFVEHVGAYQRVLSGFKKQYEAARVDLPLIDTKNLFFQDNANIYEFVTGNRVETMPELFTALIDAPYLPLYEVFTGIFGREEEFGTTPLDNDGVEGLQRWLRRRAELDRSTADNISQTLNNAVIDDGSTFDPSYAARSPAIANGYDTALEMDQNESPIYKRYRNWLQRTRP